MDKAYTDRLRDEIEAEGIECVVYGKGLAEMRWINATLVAALSAGQEAEQTAKLTKPARVGGTIFQTGVAEGLVIDRAQREYEYRNAPPSVNPPEPPEQGAVANSIDLWHKLLEWNRQQADPLIKVGYEYAVAEQAIKFYATPPNQPGSALKLAREQANDAGLWFKAKYASEQYLQDALRAMHRAVEGAEAQNSGEGEAVAWRVDPAYLELAKHHADDLYDKGGMGNQLVANAIWHMHDFCAEAHPSAGAEAVRQDAVMVPREPTDSEAERFCELVNWHPGGVEGKMVEGQVHTVTFRELAKGYIRAAMLAAAPGQQSAETEGE